jgi:hypothetical protein
MCSCDFPLHNKPTLNGRPNADHSSIVAFGHATAAQQATCCSIWLSRAFRGPGEVCRHTGSNLLAQSGMIVRVQPFSDKYRMGERVDVRGRRGHQTLLIRRWETKPEPDAKVVEEPFNLGWGQRRHCAWPMHYHVELSLGGPRKSATQFKQILILG